ncbi:hypothetical protein [Streptomyces sp. FT1]|uniref:hypothetical protein n=1 Tax=Streptomyces sp. FT1 TaxID=2871486 RepID=UPI00224F2A36|nr:hypothetical protein [Streptomyces sp. FT1]MCX5456774.1 hypothetical protein [Streptomyces sp. FT1]
MRFTLSRFAGALLAGLLLALPFTGPATPPVPAAHATHDQAPVLAVEPTHAGCGTGERTGEISALRHTRDRHRAAAGAPGDGPARAILPNWFATPHATAVRVPFPDAHAPRTSGVHEPAALQVFRC